MHTYMYVVCLYVCIYLCVAMYVCCMHICIYVCMYVFTHAYLHTDLILSTDIHTQRTKYNAETTKKYIHKETNVKRENDIEQHGINKIV